MKRQEFHLPLYGDEPYFRYKTVGFLEGPDNDIVTFYCIHASNESFGGFKYLDPEGFSSPGTGENVFGGHNNCPSPGFLMTADLRMFFYINKFFYCVSYKGGNCPSPGYVPLDQGFPLALVGNHAVSDSRGINYFRTRELFTDNQDENGVIAVSPDAEIVWRIDGICNPWFDPMAGQYSRWSYTSKEIAQGEHGTLYLNGFDCDTGPPANLYALHRDGWIKWKAPFEGTIDYRFSCSSGGPVVDAHGTIYTLNKSVVSAFTPHGSLIWSYEDPSECFTYLALSPDGTLYVCSSDFVYAFRD